MHLDSGQYGEAFRIYKDLHTSTGEPFLLYLSCFCLCCLDENYQARSFYEIFSGNSATSVIALFFSALFHIQADEHDQAIVTWNQILLKDPSKRQASIFLDEFKKAKGPYKAKNAAALVKHYIPLPLLELPERIPGIKVNRKKTKKTQLFENEIVSNYGGSKITDRKKLEPELDSDENAEKKDKLNSANTKSETKYVDTPKHLLQDLFKEHDNLKPALENPSLNKTEDKATNTQSSSQQEDSPPVKFSDAKTAAKEDSTSDVSLINGVEKIAEKPEDETNKDQGKEPINIEKEQPAGRVRKPRKNYDPSDKKAMKSLVESSQAHNIDINIPEQLSETTEKKVIPPLIAKEKNSQLSQSDASPKKSHFYRLPLVIFLVSFIMLSISFYDQMRRYILNISTLPSLPEYFQITTSIKQKKLLHEYNNNQELESDFVLVPKLLLSNKNNRARFLINKILYSNASFKNRNRAKLFMEYVSKPELKGFNDFIGPKEILSEPILYAGATIKWKGVVTEITPNTSFTIQINKTTSAICSSSSAIIEKVKKGVAASVFGEYQRLNKNKQFVVEVRRLVH